MNPTGTRGPRGPRGEVMRWRHRCGSRIVLDLDGGLWRADGARGKYRLVGQGLTEDQARQYVLRLRGYRLGPLSYGQSDAGQYRWTGGVGVLSGWPWSDRIELDPCRDQAVEAAEKERRIPVYQERAAERRPLFARADP